ncbi:MAG: serine/threonine-protein kinase [Gemmataceae bacterium]
MTVSVDKFLSCLSASGLMPAEEVAALPKTDSDAKALAASLVRQKKLTTYQATILSAGQTQGLLYGDYTILEKIGEGGMGVVYKTLHRRLRRAAALKVLHPQITRSTDAVKRFRREIEASSILSHPNIVAAYDANEQEGNYYFVMELVEGIDLYRKVKAEGTVPLNEALGYILQAARGLEYAHKKGIIHRDIKPSNLLVDATGTVKILDMGLARFVDPTSNGDTAPDHLTQTGEILGSFDYMAPEQAIDTKRVDHRADIYSLGCTLYFLLSGRPPYQGETTMQKLLAHREHAIPSLRRVQGNVPLALEAVFQRMLAKNAEDRYPSMTELIQDLDTCRLEMLQRDGVVEPIHTPVPRTLILCGTLVILAVLGSHHYLVYEAAAHGWSLTDQLLFVKWYHLLAGLGMFTGIGMVLIGVLMSVVAAVGSVFVPAAPNRSSARQVHRARLLARWLLGALLGGVAGLLGGAVVGASLAQNPSLTARVLGGAGMGLFAAWTLFGWRAWMVALAGAAVGALFGQAMTTLALSLEPLGMSGTLAGTDLGMLAFALLGALIGSVQGGRFLVPPPRVRPPKTTTNLPATASRVDDDELADKETVRRSPPPA